VVGLHKNPPTGVGGSFVSTYGGQTKELFKTTNGSWWIVSSNLIQRPEWMIPQLPLVVFKRIEFGT